MAFSQNWFKTGKQLKDAGWTVTHPRPGRDLGRLGAAAGKGVMLAAGAAAAGTLATDLGLLQPAAAPASASAGGGTGLGSGISATGGKVGLQASSALGFQATPAGVAAFDSTLGLSQLGTGAALTAGSGTAPSSTKPATASKGFSTMDAVSAASALSSLVSPKMPAMPEAEALNRDDMDMPASRTEAMKLRDEQAGRRASAAGATRNENKAGLLGRKDGMRRRNVPARKVLMQGF